MSNNNQKTANPGQGKDQKGANPQNRPGQNQPNQKPGQGNQSDKGSGMPNNNDRGRR